MNSLCIFLCVNASLLTLTLMIFVAFQIQESYCEGVMKRWGEMNKKDVSYYEEEYMGMWGEY